MKKSNIILFGLITFTLLSLSIVSADIISWNAGGNNEIVISDKYIEGFFFDTDIENPMMTLVSPEQGTMDTDGVIRFTFIPSDRYNITSCSLYSQFGIYTTSTEIVNNQTNVIEVVGVDYQHPLYMDDLQWYITCIDEYLNIGTSEIRNLDTRDDDDGVVQGIVQISGLDPKFINLLYSSTWIPNKENIIKVEVFNQENQLFEPENITFDYNDEFLTLVNLEKETSGTTAYFFADNEIPRGTYEIIINVIDETKIEKKIEIKIGRDIVETVKTYKTTIRKYKTAIWIVLGVLVLSVIFLAIMFDRYRKKRKTKN